MGRPYVFEFVGWEAGTRTPIARSRVWSPTIGRPPSKRSLNLRIVATLVNQRQFLVLRQFEILAETPKAFANPSPVVGAQRQPWEQIYTIVLTLKGFLPRQTLSGFNAYSCFAPRV